MKEQLKEMLRERSVEGKITCAAAFKIADDLGVKREEVGRAADELGIRIKNCQLGCFS